MNENNPIDIRAMVEEAKTSKHKEAYRLIGKNQAYRLGVGTRTDASGAPSFFVELVLNLSPENDEEVNIQWLEKILPILKTLHAWGYLMTYQDGNCISCENAKAIQNLDQECDNIKTLLKRRIR